MTLEGACDACLRRALLLARLAPYIEHVVTGEPGSRSRELLALGDEALVRAAAGSKACDVLRAAEADDPAALRHRLPRDQNRPPLAAGETGDAIKARAQRLARGQIDFHRITAAHRIRGGRNLGDAAFQVVRAECVNSHMRPLAHSDFAEL